MQREPSDRLRTLLVGLDAACEPVLEELRAAGEIPTIASLMESGAAGPLRSQVPPWTPSAWPSIYTGVNPGKHGVYGFLSFDGYDYDVVNRTDVRERAVWEVLAEHDVTSVVCNVPVTHPPEPFDGALIPGYTAPEDPDCHPEGLLDDVRDEIAAYAVGEDRPAVDDYRVYADHDADGDAADRIADYETLVAQRGAAFRYMVDRFEPGFGFLQFQQTDTVFHELPEHPSAVERVYRAVDRELSAVLEAAEPEVVMLVSDHGIGPVGGGEFRVNSYLRDRDYVETTADGEGMPSWASIARNRLQDGEESGEVDPSLAERAVAAAGRVGITAQRVGTVLERVGLDDVVLDLVPADVVRAASERVDFAGSTAYCRDRIELGVRINLEGREPGGTVSEAEYEDVRRELIEQLAAARTPDDEPVFEDVLRREDVFDGPHVDEAPDVVVIPNGYDHYLSTTLRAEPCGEHTGGWTHKRHGALVAAGPGVEPTSIPEGACLFDVAPTVLATFGVAAAERMDGSTLPVVDSAGRREHPQFEPEEAPDEEVEADRAGDDVEDRLAALGYIEDD